MASTGIRRVVLVAVCLSVPALSRRAAAEAQPEKDQPSEHTGDQADDDKQHAALAKAVQNPIADLISVPFQNNASYNIGTNERAADTLNIQPVIPTHLGDHVLLVSRIILPISYQPTLTSTGGGSSGVGDLNPTFFFSPAKPGKLIWGAGPAFVLPTATQQAVGTGKWSVGPAAVALMQPDPWTFGVLASQVWSFAGPTDRSDVSLLTVQYFVSYNLAHAWYLTSSPILTFNWKAPSSDEWLVPFGGGVGKIFKLGKLPLNGAVQAFYNVHSSDATTLARWQARVQLTFLFPAAGAKPKPAEKEGDDSRSAERVTPAPGDLRFTGVPGDLSLAVEPRRAP
ncbi:MAG TPA: neuromedin U [Polyangia bacterium]|nr:neuromedin U [Polyangia bacterium]